jgi:hypothetical protein
MLCLYVLSIGGTYSILAAVISLASLSSAEFSQRKDVCSRWVPAVGLLSMFFVLALLLDIVVFLDTVTPTGVGQRKAPCISRVSEKVLPS